MTTDTAQKASSPPPTRATRTYPTVVSDRMARLSKNDRRRPAVSANTPVGSSNTTIPAVNAALATNTPKMSSPASSKNSVLMPQISAAESVKSPARMR